MKENTSRIISIFATVLVMLAASRMVVRIVDATVGIDDDIFMLILLLVLVNGAIGIAAGWIRRGCRKRFLRGSGSSGPSDEGTCGISSAPPEDRR